MNNDFDVMKQGSKTECVLSIMSHSTIYGRNVWLYEISTPLGNLYIVQWEKSTLELEEKYFGRNYSKADKYAVSICKKILEGKC